MITGACATEWPSDEWRQEALDRHNYVRELHGADPLELDDEVCLLSIPTL